MNSEAGELHTRLVQWRGREAELERKLEETRDLLTKADVRRAREPQAVARWNQILDNLEKSYDSLRRELERTRSQRDELEREVSRALDATGETLSQIDAEPSHPLSNADSAKPTMQEVYTPLDDNTLGVALSDPDILFNVGWRDLLRMSMEDLALLTAEEIVHIRANIQSGGLGRPGETDRRLVETRLELAAQLRESASDSESGHEERTHRRRQIILRAAIDKIQHNRVNEMTEDEQQAVLLCKQRLSLKQEPTPAEKRLLRVMEAALGLFRRQRNRF